MSALQTHLIPTSFRMQWNLNDLMAIFFFTISTIEGIYMLLKDGIFTDVGDSFHSSILGSVCAFFINFFHFMKSSDDVGLPMTLIWKNPFQAIVVTIQHLLSYPSLASSLVTFFGGVYIGMVEVESNLFT